MRKQIGQRPLAARQQTVQLPGLRRARSRHPLIRQAVTLQHDHPFKIVGNRARCGQTGHAGADHYGLLTDLSSCHRALLIHAALPPMRGTNPLRCDFGTDKGCYDCSAAILWLAAEHLAPRCRLDLAKDTDVRALLLPRSAARGGGKLYLIWFHECDRLTNFRVLMSVIGSAPRRRESSVEEDSTQRVVD